MSNDIDHEEVAEELDEEHLVAESESSASPWFDFTDGGDIERL